MRVRDQVSTKLNAIARSVGMTENRLSNLGRSFQNSSAKGQGFASMLGGVKSMVAGLAATLLTVSFTAFTSQVVEARAEYEKYAAVLENTFQSKKMGESALNMLTDFAAKTPYQLNDLQGSFVKLVNRGIIPTQSEMTKLGDLASSQGKGFDQLTEALLDAGTGEFERLKEFGIKAHQQGNMTSLTFKGITKTVKTEAGAITQAMMEFGEMKGVKGGMEMISKTLGGQISNLKDKWNSFLVAVGGQSSGAFTGAIALLNKGLDWLTENLPKISSFFNQLWTAIDPVIKAYRDLYSQIFANMGGMNTFWTILSGIIFVVQLFSKGLTWLISLIDPTAYGIYLVVGAVAALTAVLWANPVMLIVLGIIALISVIGIIIKYTDGWGKSWIGVKQIFNAVFGGMIERAKMFISKLSEYWNSFKDWFVSMWNKLSGFLGTIFSPLVEGFKKVIDSILSIFGGAGGGLAKILGIDVDSIKSGLSKIKVSFDTKSLKNDFNSIKDKLTFENKGGAKDTTSYLGANGLPKGVGSGAGKGKEDDKKKGTDGIIGGGAKQTHITINIGKLNEKIEVHTTNLREGVNEIEDIFQELLLRTVNSANQLEPA